RTARTSLAVGAPAHNRGTADLKRTIGVLIEVLPFRIEIGPGETFRSLYEKVAAETLRFLRHAGPGMAEVASGARLDVVLNYISAAFGDFDGRPVRVDWIHSGHSDAAHALRLHVHDFELTKTFLLELDLRADAFDAAEDDAISSELLRLIDACLSGPDAPLSTIDLLDPTERETLLVAFNDTGARVPEETVLDLFEASARRWPDAIAIV